MKNSIFLFVFLFIFIFAVQAEDGIRAFCNDGKVFTGCNIDEKKEILSCDDGKDKIVVPFSFNYGNGTGVGKLNNRLVPINLKKIELNGTVMFQQEQSSVLTRGSSDIRGIELENIQFLLNKLRRNIDLELYKQWFKEISDEKDSFTTLFNNDEKTILTTDNEKLTCKREEKRSSSRVQCNNYNCGKDKSGNTIHLLMDDFVGGYADLVATGANGFAKVGHVGEVYSKDQKIYQGAVDEDMPKYFWANENGSGGISTDALVPSELGESADFFKKTQSNRDYLRWVNKQSSGCTEDAQGEIDNAVEKIQTTLSTAKLVQYIRLIDNKMLSCYLAAGNTPENSCIHDGVLYDIDSFQYIDPLPRDLTEDVSITLDEAKRLFKKAQGMDDIAWNYKTDGCYARAYLMAKRFEEEGIYVEKAWLTGNLSVQDGEREIEWIFHVAPIVWVNDGNGSKKRYIIDPSTEDGPVPVEEWAELLGGKAMGGIVPGEFPYPLNTTAFERATLVFSSSGPYLPNDDLNLGMYEKELLSVDTMERYKRVSP